MLKIKPGRTEEIVRVRLPGVGTDRSIPLPCWGLSPGRVGPLHSGRMQPCLELIMTQLILWVCPTQGKSQCAIIIPKGIEWLLNVDLMKNTY